jgi:HSP20 family protein
LWPSVEANFALPLDVYQSDQAYTVVANIPGVSQDKINITLNQNVLTLSVEIEQTTPPEGQNAYMTERLSGQFSRTVTLPRAVNSDEVNAVYENGVLTLTLPIVPEAQPKRIAVKTNNHLLTSNS